jgi:hypothetical protein
MKMAAIALLLLPACATVAGVAIWALYRHEDLDDSSLVKHFLLVLTASIATAWGIGRTEAIQLRLHPELRILKEINEHPVYATIQRVFPDDGDRLKKTLVTQTATGVPLSEALLEARPLLTAMATERTGWVDEETHLLWARLTVDTLAELRRQGPELCYRALSGQTLDSQTLAQAFSAENTQEFQRAVVRVYESAHLGINHKHPEPDVRIDHNEAAREYYVIKDEIEGRFGPAVAANFASKTFPAVPVSPSDQVCAARIYQLKAMLQRPKAMAARLVDSVLR